jgi:hypothetical protein
MKKTILLLVSIFITHSFYSQVDDTTITSEDLSSNVQSFVDENPLASRSGSGFWLKSVSTLSKIQGSIYLFENWTAYATLLTENGKIFSITNLNYDTKTNRFVSKMAKDSVFVFNPSALKEVLINKKKYKRFPSSVNNFDFSYYNIIARVKKSYILKETKKILKEGVLNKLSQKRSPSKYIPSSKYYYYDKEGFKKLRLKKKYILNLLESDKRKKVKEYAKTNSLSFKKDEDLKVILDFYNKL